MLKQIFIIILSGQLLSCSVYKASSNEGVSVSDISKCDNKGCFLSHGMNIVDNHVENDGTYIETYRAMARKSGVNYARAVGHGVLDVATLGLWEVAGTPIEGAISNNRGYITVRVYYKTKSSYTADKIEIFNAFGKQIQ